MHIYFSGLGGSGLCPLANLAVDCGYLVSGSDRELSQNLESLSKRGIKYSLEQSESEIQIIHKKNSIDWLVYTSALPVDHPHILFAKKNGIKLTKRHDLINTILKDKNLKMIAVAGTHGKTTTSGMLVWLFKQLDIPVSYLIGSNISYGRSGEYDAKSEFFVYECDEFDRNFLNFKPYLSVIPSLDFDHPDTYKDEKDYVQSFIQFFGQSQQVLTWQQIINYAEQSSNQTTLENLNLNLLQDNDIDNQSYFVNSNRITLPGFYNRRNSLLAVVTMISWIGLDHDKILIAINSFPGTARRFEELQQNLFSDYGHHPKEIEATLNLASEVIRSNSQQQNQQNLILIYQPHQNIRQHDKDIQEGYANCFLQANKVYWLPTYLSREQGNLVILTPDELVTITTLNYKKNKESNWSDLPELEIAALDDNLFSKIQEHLNHNDLVVCMGAGDVDSWIRKNLLS